MRYKFSFFLLLVLPALLVTSCKFISKKGKGQAVAECYGQYLYKDDLKGLILPGTMPNDSIALTKQFIDNWVMQQVMLHQAENNLSEEQKNFDEQIESYRNSLVIYAYESELVRQKLDTTVTMNQIESFYKDNLANFQLRENIVKVKYVKIPETAAKTDLVNKATRLLKSNNDDDADKLLDLCQNSLLSCYTDNEDWMSFDELLKEIPIKTDDQEDFLNNRKYYETKDSLFVYLIKFNDYKTKEGVSPLSFEVDNIRNLILNRRKVELMDKMQREVFQDAMDNKEFTIY